MKRGRPRFVLPLRYRRKLGIWTDARVAKAAGCSLGTVFRIRSELAIRPTTNTGGRFLDCPPEIEDLLATRSVKDLAALAGVSHPTVRRWRAERSIVAKRGARPGHRKRESLRALNDAQEAEAVARYDAGETLQSIATSYGVSREWIRLLTLAHGRPPRRPVVARRAVRRQERAAKIREAKGGDYVRAPARRRLEPYRSLLGVEHDEEVGARCGVTAYTVRRERERLGIAPPPPESPGRAKGTTRETGRPRTAYLLRKHRHLSWRAINRRMGVRNSCAMARDYALRTGSPWPIEIEKAAPDENVTE